MQMAQRSKDRREEWIMDATLSNKFHSKYFNGSIPLINPKHHTFRDIDLSESGFAPSKSKSDVFSKVFVSLYFGCYLINL